MATLHISARRLVLAGGFAVAIAAAPAVAAFTVPSIAPSFGACPTGETEDIYTNDCTPDLVPNSPELPQVDNIPCTGRNSGQCIGLSEEQQVPVEQPSSTVGSSPTVTGSTN